MNCEVIQIETEDGRMSEHSMIRKDASEGLFIMFPGGNNSCNRPVMNYVKKEMLLNNYDVLTISYEALDGGKVLAAERLTSVNFELIKLHTKLKIKDYSKVVILSRSVGNIVASKFRKSLGIKDIKQCFIAPIPGAVEYIIELGGLVITGREDEYMTESSRQELIDKGGVDCFVIDQANHSLEVTNSNNKTLEITRNVGMQVVGYFED